MNKLEIVSQFKPSGDPAPKEALLVTATAYEKIDASLVTGQANLTL